MEDKEKKELEKHKLPEEKVGALIKDIKNLGFKVEETEEGEIKISE